jgi:hypothetical protein
MNKISKETIKFFFVWKFVDFVFRKQKRLEIEQAKVQQRMDMYARQDQQRAERKSSFNPKLFDYLIY